MFARACLRQVNVAFTSAARGVVPNRITVAAARPAFAFNRQWAVQTTASAPFSSSSVARSYEGEDSDRPSRRPVKDSPNPPSDTLFLGNLPYSVSDEELRIAFSQLAPVKEVRSSVTKEGVHKGWAHIQFHSVTDAKRVYESDQQDPIFIVGRDIVVDYTVSRTPGGNNGPRKTKNVDKPSRTLYFWGFEGTAEDVRTTLKDFATDIVAVRFLRDKQTMKPFGNGFVDFENTEIASKVRDAMNGVESAHNGKTMNLSYSKNPGSASVTMRRKKLEQLTSEAGHREEQEREWHDRVVGDRQAPSESQ